MKKQNIYFLALAFFAFSITSCTKVAEEESMDQVVAEMEPDMAAIKAEIQEMENAWAQAQNERNVDALMSMWGEDAMSMGDDQPTVVGKEALRKETEENFAKSPTGNTISFETTGVFGSEDQVTETGISVSKDAEGNVVSTGKYMAVWEKQDGKYLCIRDIYNGDAPAKK